MARSAVIGALRVNLGIDSAAFDKGLKDANSSLGRVGKAMKTAFVAAAAAATAALAGIGVAIRGVIRDADAMSKMSAKIGVPVEELSRLIYAADLSGVSVGNLQTGVSRLARNMSDAAQGTGEGAKAFQSLGISVLGADGKLKSASGIMGEIADKFATMPDGAQKTALAMILMGRSGADMIPMLNGGAAGIKRLTDEADAFGLTISAETGRAAEAFNDNISRIGYAAQGVATAMAAALLPALVYVSDALVALAKGFVDLLSYLPMVAEYAAVAGGALAVMMSPAILASIVAVTKALAVGVVGALKAVAVAAAANPLGAIVVAVTAVVVAVYHFRDEIKQVFGVDVVAITKATANTIIGAMVGAFKGVKNTWSMLPSALGDVMYATANGVIKGAESMVNASLDLISSFIAKIEALMKKLPFGVGDGVSLGGPIGHVDFGGITNPYDGAARAVADTLAQTMSNAMSEDYVGAIAKMFETSSVAASDFAGAVDTAAASIGGSGSGKSGGLVAAADKAKDAWAGLRKETAANTESITTLGNVGKSVGDAIVSAFDGVIDGSKKVGDAIKDLLKSFAKMALNSVFQSISGGFGGSGGGFVGTLVSSIPKLMGFANGGSFGVGGVGGIDSQLVAFRASPNETVTVTKPGQDMGAMGGQRGNVTNINIDASGAVEGTAAMIQRAIVDAAPDIVQASIQAGDARYVAGAAAR